MSPSEPTRRARKPAPPKRGPLILAALVAGASVDEIATTQQLSRKRVEKLLREELQRLWVAPAREYARLQIARLENIIAILRAKAGKGDLPSIDRVLRILDRMDRYHGFSKFLPAPPERDESVREKLLIRLDRAAAGMLSAPSDS
jgi:hypothetical protein